MHKLVPRQPNVISVRDLAAQLSDSRSLVLLDIRFTPGKPGRREDFLKSHLPAALYIDLPSQLADPVGRAARRGSNPVPEPDQLRADLRRLGVRNDSTIVVYDDSNGAPAARAWWVLTWASIVDVRLLEGGLTAWHAAGLPLSTGETAAERFGDVDVTPGHLPVIDIDAAARFPSSGTLLDIRPLAQFGTGHIPGARSFPVDQLVGPDNRPLSGQEIADRLQRAGIDTSRPLAAYCGGGVASTLFVHALAQIGKEVPLYPGSWSEWTADRCRPVER